MDWQDDVRRERQRLATEQQEQQRATSEAAKKSAEARSALDSTVRAFWSRLVDANSKLDPHIRLPHGDGRMAVSDYFPADGHWSFFFQGYTTEFIGHPEAVLFIKHEDPAVIHFGSTQKKQHEGKPTIACLEPGSEWNSVVEQFFGRDTLTIRCATAGELRIDTRIHRGRMSDSVTYAVDSDTGDVLLKNLCMPGQKSAASLCSGLRPLQDRRPGVHAPHRTWWQRLFS